MKGFLFNSGVVELAPHRQQADGSKKEKEARMNIRINYIFWKEGPLLPRFLLESNAWPEPGRRVER